MSERSELGFRPQGVASKSTKLIPRTTAKPVTKLTPHPYAILLPESRMAVDARTRVTEIVAGLSSPTSEPTPAAEELFPLVYDELRKLAGGLMSRERRGHTLQPTALVNEAYLRLVDLSRINWRGRTHFFAAGAKAMQRILIDHARRRGSLKRGAGWQRVTLSGLGRPGSDELDEETLLSLDRALEKLAGLDARGARVAALRFFGGLSVAEVAEFLGVSKRTVEADWTHARVWLRRELDSGSA